MAIKITTDAHYKNFACVDISDDTGLELIVLYFAKPEMTLSRIVVRESHFSKVEQLSSFGEAFTKAAEIAKNGYPTELSNNSSL